MLLDLLFVLPFLLICAKIPADEGLQPPKLCALGWKDAFCLRDSLKNSMIIKRKENKMVDE